MARPKVIEALATVAGGEKVDDPDGFSLHIFP
jgi:hypothetical protein